MINCNNLFWVPTDKEKERGKKNALRTQSPADLRSQ